MDLTLAYMGHKTFYSYNDFLQIQQYLFLSSYKIMGELNQSRSLVIEMGVNLEEAITKVLGNLLGFNAENSKSLGTSSESLSFNSKVILLLDMKVLKPEERENLKIFMEIRNKFAHVRKADSFKSCELLLPNAYKKLRKLREKGNRDEEVYLKALFRELYWHLQGAVISIGLQSEFQNQKIKLKDQYESEFQKLNMIIQAIAKLNPKPKLGIDRLLPLRELMSELEIKIDRLEEKIMNDEIETVTYKKWFSKYSGQKAFLDSEIQRLGTDQKGRWKKATKLLDNLIDIPAVFNKADILDQHSLIKEVFKHGITYSDGKCRTPSLNPAFSHNTLAFNKIGLLKTEQPCQDSKVNLIRSGNES